MLLDFGVAHYGAGTAMTALTLAGSMVGTLAYMAPEQACASASLTAAADVYALGVVAYDCLAGNRERPVQHAVAALAQILFENVPPLDQVCPHVPSQLAELVARMLTKDPAQRPADGGVLLRELLALDPLGEVGPVVAAAPAPPVLTAPLSLHSLVLAVAAPVDGHDSAEDEESERRRRALEETLIRLGGQPSFFDGSLLLTLPPLESAHDQVAKAARCALLIKEKWPAAAVAVTTGRGQSSGSALTGEVVERAAQLLRDGPRHLQGSRHLAAVAGASVWVDALSASLLERRFVLIPLLGGALLTGESTSTEMIRPVLGTCPPCLGREQELTILEAILDHSRLESQAQAVLITAPPGLGKTRLRQELALRAQRRSRPPIMLLGSGQVLAAGAPYALLGQGLRRLCGIESTADPLAAYQRLLGSCTELLSSSAAARAAQFLSKLCALHLPEAELPELRAAHGDSKAMASHLLWALTEFLRASCGRAPLLWVLDDLQWGDALSISLIDGVLRALAEHPLTVLALGRPEVKLAFPAIRHWPNLKEWTLWGISRSASERLVHFVLGAKAAPGAVARIAQQADGNPLLLEELLRTEDQSAEGAHPDTVLAIVQARLQQLPAPARLMLSRASVFGERFWRDGLLALLPPGAAEELDQILQLLTRAEFISAPPRAARPREGEFSFRHALLREAAYSLLGEAQKRLLHKSAADYFERTGEPDELVLAEHYSRSSEPFTAARYFARAAAQLLEGSELAGSRTCVERGLDCQGPRAREDAAERVVRGELLGIQTTLFYRTLDLAGVVAAGTEALELLPTGSESWCKTFHSLFSAAMILGRTELLQALGQRFLEVEPDPAALAAYAGSGAILLTTYSSAGRREAAQTLWARMESRARSASSDPIVQAWLRFGEQQFLRLLMGMPWAAWVAGQKASEAAAATANQRWIGYMEAGAANTELELGMASGKARLRAALALLATVAEESTQGYAMASLAQFLAQETAHAAEAADLAKQVLERYPQVPLFTGMCQITLARTHAVTGALAAAEEAARTALRLLTTTPPVALGAHAQLIEVLLAAGQRQAARQAADAAMLQLEQLGGVGWMDLAVRLMAIEVELAEGRLDRARADLRLALATLQARAAQIPDASCRQGYLQNLRENARLRALGAQYLSDPIKPAAHADKSCGAEL